MANISKRWLLLILIILSIAVNLYFRSATLFLPHFNQAAKEEVYSSLKEELRNNLYSTYPGLADTISEKSFKILFKEYIKEKQPQVSDSILKRAKELKDYYRDERGFPYLLETDSYRWVRRVQNFINTGKFGTSLINGAEFDDLMSAPAGVQIEPQKLHFYSCFYIYKLLHFFDNSLSLDNCLSFHPIIISVIMLLFIFVACSLLGVSYLGSFIASLVIGLSNLVLMRTSFAWLDTDVYNILFPLSIMSTLAYSFRRENFKYYFLAISGFLIGIYSGFWASWWLVFYTLLLALFLYKLEAVIYNKSNSFAKRAGEASIGIIIFTISSYVSVLLISGAVAVKNSFVEPLSYLTIREGLTLDNFWPNLAFTVGELRRAGIESIVSNMGGSFLLYGGIVGLLLLFISQRKKTYRQEQRFLFFNLFVWLLAALGLAHFGLRFILFLAIPTGISAGLLWDFLIKFINQKQISLPFASGISRKIKIAISCLIFVFICSKPLYNASKLKLHSFMNDTMWNMMNKINEKTSGDAIIYSSWDLGDYVMTLAQRATLNDPSWQYTPTTYWLHRVLISKNEEEALAIIRMLNSGGNKAFEELSKALGNNKFRAMEAINKILLLNKDGFGSSLSGYKADNNQIEKVLNLLQQARRPAYLLLHYHMVEVLSAIAVTGSWDFNKLELWQERQRLQKEDFLKLAKEKFNYTQDYAQGVYDSLKLTDNSKFLRWVSNDEYSFYTPYSENKIEPGQNLFFFDNGLMVDKDNLRAYYRDGAGGKWIIPGYLISVDKDGIKETVNTKGDKSYSVLLYQKDESAYKATLFTSSLKESLFFKLFFAGGRGLENFKLIHHECNKDGVNNIYLYKINL